MIFRQKVKTIIKNFVKVIKFQKIGCAKQGVMKKKSTSQYK
jgi:hypothetical protein